MAFPTTSAPRSIVQAMVFGNLSPASGSGVGFTRSPADGANELYVDYLSNAQGEDVVAGRRKAMGLPELERRAPDGIPVADRGTPAARAGVPRHAGLRVHGRGGSALYAAVAHRQAHAARGRAHRLRSRRGRADRRPAEALARLNGVDIDAIETVTLKPAAQKALLARGTSASAGVAVGAAVFDPERVAKVKERGQPVILVRDTAETSDIGALAEADALVTAEGARTSHAAVVARQLGKVCVVGCEGIAIDPSGRKARFGAETIEEGAIVSVDGARAEIYAGAMEVVTERPTELLAKIARGGGRKHRSSKSTPRRGARPKPEHG